MCAVKVSKVRLLCCLSASREFPKYLFFSLFYTLSHDKPQRNWSDSSCRKSRSQMGLTICNQFSIKFHSDISLTNAWIRHTANRNATFRALCSSAVPNNNSQSINNSQLKWLVCSCDMYLFHQFSATPSLFSFWCVRVSSLVFFSLPLLVVVRSLLFIRCDTIVVLISNDFLRAHTHFNITSSLYLLPFTRQRGKWLLQMLNIPCENIFFIYIISAQKSADVCMFVVWTVTCVWCI